MTVSRHFSRLLFLSLLGTIIALICNVCLSFPVNAAALAPASGSGGTCQTINVDNIALGDGQPAGYTIYGELCNPRPGRSHTVQLLISGATYSHLYWDWPYENATLYSAVHFFNASGYSTFNIDRIGIGNSSHPASADVDVTSNAYVVHELVGRLKAGTISGPAFEHVILVGHSLGSMISVAEATTYHDVDGVVLTGFLHHYSPAGLGLLQLEPANQDPSGRFSNLDAGYLTSVPNTRGPIFYDAQGSDPAVIASDENTKETVTPGEENEAFPIITGNLSLQITVPVLLVVGQEDALFCGTGGADCSSKASLYQEEAPFYSPQAQLQVQVIPNTGHDLNLHYSAPLTYALIEAWSLVHVAPFAN